jgi:hypothetical protein
MSMDSSAGEPRVLGLKPCFPWPLSRWVWLTEPVRAERMAALRIGIALIMLLDVFFTFYWHANDYFGPDSLGEPAYYKHRYRDDREEGGKRWSLLRDATKSQVKLLMGLWVVASFCLLIGFGSRLSAIFCWVMSVSAGVSNDHIDNAGDTVRTLTLLYLMLGCSGAAWSIDTWIRRRFYWAGVRGEEGEFRGFALMHREQPSRAPYFIHPWSLRLLFVQMMLIYTCNGLYKAVGDTWDKGTSLYFVLADLTLSRFSSAQFHLPDWLTTRMTITVLWWEMLFAPIMLVPWRTLADLIKRIPYVWWLHVLFRWTREIFLIFGASFHLGILISMEIGGFAPYMLCLYLPLMPWERFRQKPTPTDSAKGA